jgi:glycosyltransferase involved in cell wall biosynthesis
MTSETILAFSPERWNGVACRTQQILTRLSARWPVFFVEAPVESHEAAARWQFSAPLAQGQVCQPYIPGFSTYTPEEQTALLRSMLRWLLRTKKLQHPIGWMATPMAEPLLDELTPTLVVYDCIDDLTRQPLTSPEWARREARLMQCADVVFTTGPSLHQSKTGQHHNLHCLPGYADVQHFRQARQSQLLFGNGKFLPVGGEPPDQTCLPHPRLGYYGPLDHRIDFDLLDMLARVRSEWQIVLIGPLEGRRLCQLPRRPNLHYLGPRPHTQLPQYVAGWDLLLLPVAVNAATRYLNPTKLLEYMAAERMIVSTQIPDVVEPYGDIVHVSHSPNSFIVACDQALNASDEQRRQRIRLMRDVLAGASWTTIARTVQHHLQDALNDRQRTRRMMPVSAVQAAAQAERLFSPAVRERTRWPVAAG